MQYLFQLLILYNLLNYTYKLYELMHALNRKSDDRTM